MANTKYKARKFQECTIDKVISEIFDPKRKGPRRFLVADEVGLGKTIIAKHVIDSLRGGSGRKVIIYVSSSLDITKQNRTKLAENQDTEIVSADRINLIFEKKDLDRGIQIITMTPGTSLSVERSLGSAAERRAMAFLVQKYYQIGYYRMAAIFKGGCKSKNFYQSLKCSQKPFEKLELERAIVKGWKEIRLKSGLSFVDALYDKVLDEDSIRELIREMRRGMATAILKYLKPELIIFDEFQKFRELTDIHDDGSIIHDLSKILLKPETPTLLLSATPYRLYTGNAVTIGSNETTGHYQDLVRTFSFLTGKPTEAEALVKDIEKYGFMTLKLTKSNLKGLLDTKEVIESKVMKYMSRAERVNFGDPEKGVKPIFLSDRFDAGHITKENFLEFFKLAQHVESQAQLLTYWKSGAHAMSYMYGNDYKLIDDAQVRSESTRAPLNADPGLHTQLNHHPKQHLKLKYLYKDILQDGHAFNYLWLPPTKSYYEGMGPFHPNALKEHGPKKGLVFSSWRFVPRMIAGELNALKMKYFGKKEHDVKPSGESWSKLLFPSSFLAGIISHKDFLEHPKYNDLVNLCAKRIKKELHSKGYKVITNGSGQPLHSILAYLEFGENEAKWREYQKILKGKSSRVIKKEKDAPDLSKLPIDIRPTNFNVSEKAIKALAIIAIANPSVCLLRSIQHLRGKATENTWLEVSSFSLHELRNFISRAGHMKVFMKNGRGGKPVDRVLDYFKNGNFQAVIDEYLFQAYTDKSKDKGVTDLLVKLSHILGPNHSPITIRTSKKKKQMVQTDVVCSFGEGLEESKSRDAKREGFNSPFWPFILSTTSVGQEGLDFHLYCNDIYHWNLPSSPVDFEQREGRLNRYNNYSIRKNIVNDFATSSLELPENGFIWDLYFAQAQDQAHRNDRYNLGMSPNWIYTPTGNEFHYLNRHVMDLPCSQDRNKYNKLMDDLQFYRLALGQPDQKEFMGKIQSAEIFKELDLRSVTLDFFPSQYRDRDLEVECIIENRAKTEQLITDCLEYLKEIKHVPQYQSLDTEIRRHVNRIRNYLDLKQGSESKFTASIEALYHFIDPFDKISDRNPLNGFVDDLKKLKAA